MKRIKYDERAYHARRCEVLFNYPEMEKVKELKHIFDADNISEVIRFCVLTTWDLYANPMSAVRFDVKKAKEKWNLVKFR